MDKNVMYSLVRPINGIVLVQKQRSDDLYTIWNTNAIMDVSKVAKI